MSNPTISVIVPVYNAEKYIERCIKSILKQTVSDLELILVDDGSSDNSGSICDEYAKKDARVKIVHKKNGGAASARNIGIKLATGKYVGFCDADDFLHENMYEELIKVLNDNELQTISCLSNTLNEDGELVFGGTDDKKLSIIPSENYIKQIFLHKADVSLCTRITKSETIKGLIIPEGRRVEDFYFTIELLFRTDATAIYNYPYYQYTENSKSVTHSADASIYFDGLYFLDKANEILDKKTYCKEQEYFIFKMLYMLFLSLKKEDFQKYKLQLLYHKSFVRKNLINLLKNKNLLLKEKLVLITSLISLRVPNLLYLLKNRV